MSSQSTRFYSLDALRGVAALAVVFSHTGYFYQGHLAVDLFFAMSGFVLMHAYAGRLRFGSYLVDRAIRLGPLAFMGGLLGYVMNGGSPWIMALVPTGSNVMYPANVVLWSLLFEVFLSVGFGLLYRFGKWAWWPLAIVSGLFWAWSVYSHGTTDIGHSWNQFGAGLARATFWFCVGIAIYTAKPRVPDFPSHKLANVLGELSYPLYVSHAPIVLRDWPPMFSVPAAIIVAVVLAYAYDKPARSLLRIGRDNLGKREGGSRDSVGGSVVETRPL